LGVLKPKTRKGMQGLPQKNPPFQRCPCPLEATHDRDDDPTRSGDDFQRCPRPLEAAHPCAARGEQRRILMPVVPPDQKDALVPWKRRIPVRRAGSSGVSRCLWFCQIKRTPSSPGSGAPLCGTQGAAAYTGACGSARSKRTAGATLMQPDCKALCRDQSSPAR